MEKRPSDGRMSPRLAESMRSLNDAQRTAVETIEGPVMVVAGPGTGKTQVTALRVANILQRTQVYPRSILCLTFSVSAATEMRERLRSVIGADAYGVAVRNFHGFCRDLIEEHPHVFQEFAALELISDLDRYREVNKIIDQLLPHIRLVNRKNPHALTAKIIGRISDLKREGKADPVSLLKVADAFDAEMAGEGREGTKVRERAELSARKFRDLIEVFTRYQEMLTRTGRYDYDDMILTVISALEREEWLLATLHERYQYLLVDEVQDTNGAQYRLIELLTTYPTLDHEPNLFVVGDDDQAIYRFQGANLRNILAFHERFPKAPLIPLTVSYRCSQPILDAAMRLISHNTERLVGKIPGLMKDLTAASGAGGEQPKLLLSPSDVTEPYLIADLVEERLKAGMHPGEIAILVQTNSELQPIEEVLHSRGIPVQMTGKIDLLAHPLVLQALAIVKAIVHPQDSAALATALGCACFGCHPADLGRLFAARRDRSANVLTILLALDDSQDPHSALTLHDRTALLRVRDLLLDLHHKLGSLSPLDTLDRILRDTGLLPTAEQVTNGSFNPVDFAALQELFERVRSRTKEGSSYTLADFVSELEYYESREYRELRLTYDLPHLRTEGVELMTAHQSKGREFTCVILANFRDGHWDRRRTPPSIAIPEDLLFDWSDEVRTFERSQDERRVTFVAMTRAKRELLMTCPKETTTGDRTRTVSPSAFFAEAGDLPEETRDLRNPERATLLLSRPPLVLDEAFTAFVREKLENFSLSASALNRFLEDPRLFLDTDLLGTPTAMGTGFLYGNAVHAALKEWGLSAQRKTPMAKAEFIGAFSEHLREREPIAPGALAGLLSLGEEALSRYYDLRLSGEPPIIHAVEFTLAARLGDIPIKGTIDRIDREGETSARAHVIDYKTGHPQTESEIRGGDYYRQLVFYAILLQQSRSVLEPVSFTLDFVGEGSDHPVERTFTIAESDLTELRTLVQQVWAKITALDFMPLGT